MNLISFSIFGDDPIYWRGAISNAKLVDRFYPGWKMIAYYDDTTPRECIDALTELRVLLRDMQGKKITKKLWRFLAHDEKGCERFLCRDADSRLNEREQAAVQAWIASGKGWHVMRDHPHHVVPMMAGMWGGTTGRLRCSMLDLIRGWKEPPQHYGYDQRFLAASLWPTAEKDCVVHDSNNPNFPWPTPRGERFVGEVFDEYDNPTEWRPRPCAV